MEIEKKHFDEFMKRIERKGIDTDTLIDVIDTVRDLATDSGCDQEGFLDELLDELENA